MENNQDSMNNTNENSEDFSYLKETIKKDPSARSDAIRSAARYVVGGLLIGVFACLGFYALKPWVLSRGSSEQIIIETDDLASAEEKDAHSSEQIQVLDSANYKELMNRMSQVAKAANKSVTAVTGTKNTTKEGEEILDAKDPTNSVSGVIVTITDQEVLILTETSILKRASTFSVKFCDDATYVATLKSKDENTGLAVVSVAKSDLSESTKNTIQAASFGNSLLVKQGESVIALGNPFGYADGVGYGIVSNAEYDKVLDDGEYRVIGTDIAATEDGTGALFDFSGDLIGIIMPGVWENSEGTLCNAYSLSDLKPTIELLVNGAEVPYIGIHGTTISKEIAEDQEMPEGVYVGSVSADSPAMEAGIQSGDIITQVGKKEITTYAAYQNAVLGTKMDEQIIIKGKRRGSNGYVDITFTVTIKSKK